MSDLISRQAAIDALESQLSDWNDDYNIPVRKSIENIERLPSAQPDLDEWCTDCNEYDSEKHCCPRFNHVIRRTLEERKKGKWMVSYLEHEAMGIRPKLLYCSECCQCIAYPTNFCPNCGADMRESHCDDCRFYDEECVYCPVKQERREE